MNIRDVAEDAELSRREALKGAGLGVAAAGGAHVIAEGAMGQSGGPDDEISGVVKDDNGGVSGAVVEAVPHDDSYDPLETTTASDGSYTFTQSELHDTTLLYHVVARDGTETSPRRGEQNYPFISADGSPDIPPSGVSRWTFDNADTSGSTAIDVWDSNDGTINGATTGVSGANQTYTTNEAYSFDGTDDRVELPDLGLGKSNSFSLCAWVNVDTLTSGGQTVIGRYDGSDDILRLRAGTDSQDFYDIRLGHLGGDEQQAQGGDVKTGSWQFVVVTFDSSTPETKLYLDGTEVANSTATLTDFATNDGPWIGGRNDNAQYLGGDMDDVRLYDKALSSTEVNDLYNTGSI